MAEAYATFYETEGVVRDLLQKRWTAGSFREKMHGRCTTRAERSSFPRRCRRAGLSAGRRGRSRRSLPGLGPGFFCTHARLRGLSGRGGGVRHASFAPDLSKGWPRTGLLLGCPGPVFRRKDDPAFGTGQPVKVPQGDDANLADPAAATCCFTAGCASTGGESAKATTKIIRGR